MRDEKVKLLRCMVVLCTAAILSGTAASTSAYASANMHSSDTADAPVMYTGDEIPPEMEAFCEQMMSGDELKEGEERVFDTWNGEKFNVEVVDVIEFPVNTCASVTTTSKTFVFLCHQYFGR